MAFRMPRRISGSIVAIIATSNSHWLCVGFLLVKRDREETDRTRAAVAWSPIQQWLHHHQTVNFQLQTNQNIITILLRNTLRFNTTPAVKEEKLCLLTCLLREETKLGQFVLDLS
ncbi:hypothetical protein YC2023_009966 [Brassica napus]